MGSAMKFLWWMVVARKVDVFHGYGNHCWRNFELKMVFFLPSTLPNQIRVLPFFVNLQRFLVMILIVMEHL
jgi:hypothetical protein